MACKPLPSSTLNGVQLNISPQMAYVGDRTGRDEHHMFYSLYGRRLSLHARLYLSLDGGHNSRSIKSIVSY